MEKKYQIQLLDKDRNGTFCYFVSEEGEEYEKACDVANEFLRERRERDEMRGYSIFYRPYRAIKTVPVVEYDNEKKQTKRGGHKFKLTLSFFEVHFRSGKSERNEWYEVKESSVLATNSNK